MKGVEVIPKAVEVETAVGLQILGDRAVADPDLELTILASLGK